MAVLEIIVFHPYSFYVHNRQKQTVLENITTLFLLNNTIMTLTK